MAETLGGKPSVLKLDANGIEILGFRGEVSRDEWDWRVGHGKNLMPTMARNYGEIVHETVRDVEASNGAANIGSVGVSSDWGVYMYLGGDITRNDLSRAVIGRDSVTVEIQIAGRQRKLVISNASDCAVDVYDLQGKSLLGF